MPRQDGHTQDNCPTPPDVPDAADSWAATVAAHRDRTRARILEAAVALLTERGAAGLAMTTLARRAGVARATLYNYFPDAEHVLEALVETEVAAFLRDLDQRLAPITDAGARLDGAVDALVAWVARQAGRRPARGNDTGSAGSARTVDIAGIHRPLAAIEDRIAEAAVAARAAGILPPQGDPALAARFAVALAFGMRGQLAGSGSERIAAALREFLLGGFLLGGLGGLGVRARDGVTGPDRS
ncbi:MAG TPA: TetR/AcrR family transcriptional regulator [Actinocrinis sp.]